MLDETLIDAADAAALMSQKQEEEENKDEHGITDKQERCLRCCDCCYVSVTVDSVEDNNQHKRRLLQKC